MLVCFVLLSVGVNFDLLFDEVLLVNVSLVADVCIVIHSTADIVFDTSVALVTFF